MAWSALSNGDCGWGLLVNEMEIINFNTLSCYFWFIYLQVCLSNSLLSLTRFLVSDTTSIFSVLLISPTPFFRFHGDGFDGKATANEITGDASLLIYRSMRVKPVLRTCYSYTWRRIRINSPQATVWFSSLVYSIVRFLWCHLLWF